MNGSIQGFSRAACRPIQLVMGVEDRDWYREESSPVYRRELERSTGGRSRSTSTATIGGGAAAAALVSLAVFVLASQAGVAPRLTFHRASPSAPRQIDLGKEPDLVARGPAGRRWCIAVPGRRICAVTAESESGRNALTRALRAQGYDVPVSR